MWDHIALYFLTLSFIQCNKFIYMFNSLVYFKFFLKIPFSVSKHIGHLLLFSTNHLQLLWAIIYSSFKNVKYLNEWEKAPIKDEIKHLLLKPIIIPDCTTAVLASDCSYNKLQLI